MVIKNEKNSLVAPMPDLCRMWQQKGDVEMDWYFNLAEKFGSDKIIFNSVSVNSPLFQRLREKSQEHDLAPVYVVTTEQFREIENLREHLEQGVHYTVLIFAPLSTELVFQVNNVQDFLPQLNFVILARKDWNVQNCFRSVPHFMRGRLFVDFPVSLHRTDPFYEPAELTTTRQKFEKDFMDREIRSYCPNLGIYNEWGRKNISHLSRPRKLLKNKPKVSIIALDPDLLKALEKSQVLQKSPEDFEILITRVAGQKTKVIPKIKAVTTTRYWAHPIDASQPVSAKVLANFTAGQADGDILLFLDPQQETHWDGLLSVLVSGEVNFGKLMVRKGLFVFDRKQFFEAGGFDELLESWQADRLRLQKALYEDLLSMTAPDPLTPMLEKMESVEDQLLLAHLFADQIHDFSFLVGKITKTVGQVEQIEKDSRRQYQRELWRDKYLTLHQATPKVAIEGHVAFLFRPFLAFWQKRGWKLSPLRLQHPIRQHGWKLSPLRLQHPIRQHGWKLSPLRLQHPIRQHGWKLSPLRLQHPIRQHGWKLSPLRLSHIWRLHAWKVSRPYHFVKQNVWRLNPMTHEWPWKIYYAVGNFLYYNVVFFHRRVYGLGVRLYWQFFRFAYPIRKVYYFTQFQYEKRVLWEMHGWKLSPLRLQHPIRQHGWKLSPLRLQHPIRQHGWKLSPLRLRHIWRLHSWKVSGPYHVIKQSAWKLSPLRLQHPIRQHGWKLSPLRLRHIWRLHAWKVSGPFHFVKQNVWRLNPMTHEWPWKIYYAVGNFLYYNVVFFHRRVYGLGVRLYWQFFRFAYPIRKVYYFTQFQYEKRVLGLHSKVEKG